MVGVPVLLIVCVSAFVPFVWVMGVVVGVFGVWWRVFQCRVAVVSASRRVPGVVLGFGVWVACSGVVWLVLVGVCWLVCVLWWFRMLTCLASFFLLVLSFVLSCCLVNNGLPGCVGAGGCLLVGCFGWCGRVLGLVGGWLRFPLFVGGWVCFVDGQKCVCLLLVGYWVVACVLVSRGVRVGLLVVVLLVRECECWCLVVSVVVWVWGALLLVAFCLCGFVTLLLRVACRLGLMLGGVRLC